MSEQRADKLSPESFCIVVSAPSGTGKTSICRQVLKSCPNIRFSVSYTTRPPRPGEVDGRDYHFVSEDAFRQMLNRDDFVEWAENYGHLYGTSETAVKTLLKEGYDVMLDVEPRGARALKNACPGGVFVYILPPTLGELKARLDRRGFESSEVINMRFNKAVDEIREVFWYDYVIFNDKLNEAIDQLHSIYVAEKCRRDRMNERLQVFLKRENN
ncbi:MAG: guanylate kinase [Syntrophales bacterium]|nr:guanylate kinase [Syntrophales bacterium]